tara:strand:+ start:15707 stop:18673 length:2967 start_codon:yes stop_codon:yes gene_type:complete
MANGEVKIEIYKNRIVNGALDMYSTTNFPLAINYGIKNISNINKTTGTYSKTLKIPATKNNNKLLKHIGFDNVMDIEQYLDNSIEVRVSLNHNILVVGRLQVKSAISDTKVREYQITIIGNNVTWGKRFAEEDMCDVTNFNNGQVYTWNNAFWNFANVALQTQSPAGAGAVFCLPVICWGEWKKHFHLPTGTTIKKMDLSEVRPSYFVDYLVRHYFLELGYKIESNFFETDTFKKLIIPTSFADWNRDNQLGHPDREIRAEFGSTHSVNIPPNSVNHIPMGFLIRRVGTYIQSTGVNKLVPFDVETKDVFNKQTIALAEFASQTTLGWEYNEGFFNTTPAPYHSFIAPQSANYEINVSLELAMPNHTKVYASVLVFRNLVINNRPSLQLYNSNTQSQQHLIMSTHTDPIFTNMCLGVGNNGDPIQLVSKEIDGANFAYLDALDANSNFTHLHQTTLELNTGDIYLQNGDEVAVLIHNMNDNPLYAQTHPFLISDNSRQMLGRHNNKIYKIENFTSKKTTFEVNRVGAIANGDNFLSENFLPCDIKKIDLINALTGMFNLYWTTNELSRTVTVEPYDDFFKDTSQALDFTHLVDYNKPSSTKFVLDDINKNLYFKYKKDTDDGYVDEIEKQLEQEFHSLEVELQDGFIDEVQEIGNKISSPTYMFEDWELTKNTEFKIRLPLIVSEYIDDIDISTKPEVMENHNLRILSYEGMQPIQTDAYGSWAWNNGLNGIVREYPAASTFHPTDSAFENLDFGDNAVKDGLYKRFWANFVNKINISPRIKTVHINFSSNQISQLDLTKPIYIEDFGGGNGSYWIIHRIIDYKPTEHESTKVELLQYYNTNTSVAPKNRKLLPKLGKTTSGTANENTTKIVRGATNEYKNESLILRANNSSPKNNGNILLGSNLRTQLQNQILLGQYNKQDDDAILIIGGGTSETDRRNVLTVASDGSVHLGENGGGSGMVTKDDNGNIVDLYTEEKNETITKVIKG